MDGYRASPAFVASRATSRANVIIAASAADSEFRRLDELYFKAFRGWLRSCPGELCPVRSGRAEHRSTSPNRRLHLTFLDAHQAFVELASGIELLLPGRR